MAAFKKLLPCALLTLLSVSTAAVYGKGQKKASSKKQSAITLGLYTGKEVALSPISLKFPNKGFASHKGFFAAKTINTHFKFETGLAYTTYKRTTDNTNSVYFADHLVKYSIPVSVQYHFATKCRLHPYCGAGFQYSVVPTSNGKQHADVINKQLPQEQNYPSLLLTQGLIYEVNPKLQVQQSFHFTTDDNSRVLGIDLSVGYIIR